MFDLSTKFDPDHYTRPPIDLDTGRMDIDQLQAFVQRDDVATTRKLYTLSHQERAATADGDIEAAARIVQMKVSLT